MFYNADAEDLRDALNKLGYSMKPIMGVGSSKVPENDKIIVLTIDPNHWIGLKRHKGIWHNLDSLEKTILLES